jgi:hypothetical protein
VHRSRSLLIHWLGGRGISFVEVGNVHDGRAKGIAVGGHATHEWRGGLLRTHIGAVALAAPMCPVDFPSDSDLSHATVDVDFHAGDVGRILRSQEGHRSCHFFGLSKALHRNRRDQCFCEFIDSFFW